MTILVADEEQLKFDILSDLRRRLDDVFDAQGVSMKEGMNRLVEFLVALPPDMHPIVLRQVRGPAAVAIAQGVIRDYGEAHGEIKHKSQLRIAAMTPPGMGKKKKDGQ